MRGVNMGLKYRIRRTALYAVITLLTAGFLAWAAVSGENARCSRLRSDPVLFAYYCQETK